MERGIILNFLLSVRTGTFLTSNVHNDYELLTIQNVWGAQTFSVGLYSTYLFKKFFSSTAALGNPIGTQSTVMMTMMSFTAANTAKHTKQTSQQLCQPCWHHLPWKMPIEAPTSQAPPSHYLTWIPCQDSTNKSEQYCHQMLHQWQRMTPVTNCNDPANYPQWQPYFLPKIATFGIQQCLQLQSPSCQTQCRDWAAETALAAEHWIDAANTMLPHPNHTTHAPCLQYKPCQCSFLLCQQFSMTQHHLDAIEWQCCSRWLVPVTTCSSHHSMQLAATMAVNQIDWPRPSHGWACHCNLAQCSLHLVCQQFAMTQHHLAITEQWCCTMWLPVATHSSSYHSRPLHCQAKWWNPALCSSIPSQ